MYFSVFLLGFTFSAINASWAYKHSRCCIYFHYDKLVMALKDSLLRRSRFLRFYLPMLLLILTLSLVPSLVITIPSDSRGLRCLLIWFRQMATHKALSILMFQSQSARATEHERQSIYFILMSTKLNLLNIFNLWNWMNAIESSSLSPICSECCWASGGRLTKIKLFNLLWKLFLLARVARGRDETQTSQLYVARTSLFYSLYWIVKFIECLIFIFSYALLLKGIVVTRFFLLPRTLFEI